MPLPDTSAIAATRESRTVRTLKKSPPISLQGWLFPNGFGEPGLESRHGHQALLDARRSREFFLMILMLLAGCAIVLDRLPDRVQQFGLVKRLGEELNRAGLHRAHGRREVGVACDENNGNMDLVLHQFALQVQAAQTG
jgi:hypothetical protein